MAAANRTNSDARVFLLNSTVVSGFAGAKSCTFPMQVLGLDVDTMYTTQHSNHSGYPHVSRADFTRQQLRDLFFEGMCQNNLLVNRYRYLFTGFISDENFLHDVVEMYHELKLKNPDLIWFCDTVIGDRDKNGHEIYYCPKELVALYREEVLPLADIITPNQLELELLSETKILTRVDAIAAMEKLHSSGVKTIILTSVQTDDHGFEMLVSQQTGDKGNDIQVYSAPFKELPYHFTGTGDCMMGLLIGNMHLHPNNLQKVCSRSLSTMQAIMLNSIESLQGEDIKDQGTKPGHLNRDIELKIIQSLNEISNPPITYKVKKIS